MFWNRELLTKRVDTRNGALIVRLNLKKKVVIVNIFQKQIRRKFVRNFNKIRKNFEKKKTIEQKIDEKFFLSGYLSCSCGGRTLFAWIFRQSVRMYKLFNVFLNFQTICLVAQTVCINRIAKVSRWAIWESTMSPWSSRIPIIIIKLIPFPNNLLKFWVDFKKIFSKFEKTQMQKS